MPLLRPLLLLLLLAACGSESPPTTSTAEKPTAKPKNMLKNFPAFDLEGHRGARGKMPENTIPAMFYAIDAGMTTLEMDVVMSADGQVLLSHEPWLSPEFCRDEKGNDVAEGEEQAHNLFAMTYAQIRLCDCGQRAHPRFEEQKKIKAHKPLLSETLSACESWSGQQARRVWYNIEIKRVEGQDGIFHPPMPVFVDAVLAVVAESAAKERIIIQCFDLPTLRYVREKAPHIPLSLLIEHSTGSVGADIERLGFVPEIYSPYYPLVDSKTVADCHEKGIKLITWTVNESADMQALLTLGVDGIISDYPDRLATQILARTQKKLE